jgi:hypothetical protein
MLILQDAPAGIKTFLKAANLPTTTFDYVVRLMVGFVFHFGRMSASQAAGVMPAQARHRAQVARFLADCRWSKDWSQCLWMATLVLEQERKRAGRWIYILDQTYSAPAIVSVGQARVGVTQRRNMPDARCMAS